MTKTVLLLFPLLTIATSLKAETANQAVHGRGYASTIKFQEKAEMVAKRWAEIDAMNQCGVENVKVDPTSWSTTGKYGYHCSGHGYCDPDALIGIFAEADFSCE